MGNFCTKCGKKLNSYDAFCPNCKLAVVDDRDDFRNQNKQYRIIIVIVLIILIILIAFLFANNAIKNQKVQNKIDAILKDYNYRYDIYDKNICERCVPGTECEEGCHSVHVMRCKEYSLFIFPTEKDTIDTFVDYSTSKQYKSDFQTIKEDLDYYNNIKPILNEYFKYDYASLNQDSDKTTINFSQDFSNYIDKEFIDNLFKIYKSISKLSCLLKINFSDGYYIETRGVNDINIHYKSYDNQIILKDTESIDTNYELLKEWISQND